MSVERRASDRQGRAREGKRSRRAQLSLEFQRPGWGPELERKSARTRRLADSQTRSERLAFAARPRSFVSQHQRSTQTPARCLAPRLTPCHMRQSIIIIKPASQSSLSSIEKRRTQRGTVEPRSQIGSLETTTTTTTATLFPFLPQPSSSSLRPAYIHPILPPTVV